MFQTKFRSNISWVTAFKRPKLSGVIVVSLLAAIVIAASIAGAKPTSGVSSVNILDNQIPGNDFGKAAITTLPNSTLFLSDSCAGPIISLSGVTTSRYSNNTVANGTTFNRTAWYSDAVGNGTSGAFSIGDGEPPPYDVCVFGGVINGHIPLSWNWVEVHDFGGHGDRTYTGHLAHIDGARIHNVEDGWKPRELPEFGNSGVMQMRNTYMTGIRDDSIENDNFMPGFVEDSLFDGVDTFLSEQNQSGGTPVTIGPNEDSYIRITRVYVRLFSTNSDGNSNPGRWFKWQARGTVNHNLIIKDSVFATHGPEPRDGWSALDFPDGTIFEGTNYVLWLGTVGAYEATIPAGVIFLEGQAAFDKWNEVRNTWLTTHEYEPRPLDDFNPMDDAVIAPGPIHFGVIGDFGEAGPEELDVANLVKSWNPDFIITTGDNNYTDGGADTIDANIGQYYHEFIYPYTGLYGAGAATNRFFPSLGNHDWHAPNVQPYLDYFTLPNNERYYDYVWGPVHFFVIDSDGDEPDGNSSDSVQALWLQAQLAASTSPWNLVYMHHPPYSSGSNHGSSETMQWPYQEWGADAVLTGHDHTYERIVLNSFPYFVNGLGGRSSIYSFGTPIAGSVVRYNADYGAMLVEADKCQVTFQFIARTGAVIDTYALSKPAGSAPFPSVISSVRANSTPTGAASVNFTVTFSEDVTGVDTSDFSLTTTGVSGATVSGVSGSGSIFTVTVNTGTGDGTIRLNIADNDTIVDGVCNKLGGAGLGNGNFITGQVYTIEKTTPTNTPTATSTRTPTSTAASSSTNTPTNTPSPTATIPSQLLAAAGTYDDKSAVWGYTGAWANQSALKAYAGSFKYTSGIGASATVYFSGIQAKLYYTKNSSMGTMNVYIDDVYVGQIIEKSALAVFQKTWLSPVYADGVHKITFVRASGKVNVDALQVIPAPDFVAPAMIGNLSATATASYGQVNLQWTAVGDDGNTGTASSYQVRYSLTAIDTETKWSLATAATSGLPTPAPAGTTQNMTVSGLAPGVTYFFAVRAVDDGGNLSPLSSNSPSATALAPAPVPSGTYENNNGNWILSGSWATLSVPSASGGNVHTSTVVGSSAALVFNGSGFTLRYYTKSGGGLLTIYVDGVKKTILNQNSASTSIAWKTYSLVLTPGTHVIQLVDSKGKVNFDNIIIAP